LTNPPYLYSILAGDFTYGQGKQSMQRKVWM